METVQEKKCQEVFQVFVTDGTDTVSIGYLKTLLQSVGLNPSEKTVQKCLQQSEAYKTGLLEIETFIEIAKKCKEDETTIEILFDSFKSCDKEGTGTISISEMKYLLTKLGDSISEEDFKVILSDIGLEEKGDVDYKKFIEYLVNH